METITRGVHGISYGYVNSFIIDGDEGVTLIDTGVPGRYDVTARALESIGRSITDVRAIMLTHSHFDHVGGAAELKSKSDAHIYTSDSESRAICGDEPIPLSPIMERLRFISPLFRLVPRADQVNVDHIIDEETANELPEDLRVINTPGHTPGHVSYILDRVGGVLFAGDAFVSTKRGEARRGWMNRSSAIFDESLIRLTEHRFEIALFGHSPAIRTGASKSLMRFVNTLD